MAATDIDTGRYPLHPNLVMAFLVAFESFDETGCNERIAMHPNEAAAELHLEFVERFVDQQFTAAVTQRHVLLIRLQEPDVVNRNEFDALSCTRRNVRTLRTLARSECRELRLVRSGRGIQHIDQIVAAHRLQQITDGLDFERFDGMLFVCSAEDDGRRFIHYSDMARSLEPVHAGHTDI